MKRGMILRAFFVVASVGLGFGFALRSGYGDVALSEPVLSDVRAAAGANTVVTGSGTPGKLAKWTGITGSSDQLILTV